MARNRERCKGNTIIEFTLVGIPIIFVLISTFEMSRGMWIYHSLAHAVKAGTRTVIVHGNNCVIHPNNCALTLRDIATQIAQAGTGVIPDEITNVQFISNTRTETCGGTLSKLSDCISGAKAGVYWPTNAPGSATRDSGADRMQDVEIRVQYPFRSAIAMFWPGAGPGMTFGTAMLPASSKERIQF